MKKKEMKRREEEEGMTDNNSFNSDTSDTSSESDYEEPPCKVQRNDPRQDQIKEAWKMKDFTKTHGEYTIEYTRPDKDREEAITQMVDTIELNMKHYYDLPNVNEKYGWTWDKEELRSFTSDQSSRFLLCFSNVDDKKTLMGFSIVRFETEDLEEEEGWCIYIYDIHTTPEGRHRGIGTILLEELEKLTASLEGATMLRLTCFLENENAMSFYRKHKFLTDPDSPSPLVFKDAPHAILRKKIN